MQLTHLSSRILGQLSDAMRQLAPEDFCRASRALSNATIGQHLRHTLEFFICLERGLSSGVVNYDNREHDERMEKDKDTAIEAMVRVINFVRTLKENHPLVLEVGYDVDSDEAQSMETNVFRELTYNIEHAVHHMAMIKIGLRDVAPYVVIPPDFGVAVSTMRHKASLLAEH
jgi:uncharacterized damage-inducible protein DinB